VLSGSALTSGSPIGSALVEIVPKIAAGFGKQVGDQVDKSIGGALQGVGGKLTKTLTPVAIALGGAMTLVASNYNEGVDRIRVGTGKTGEALKALVDDARAVGGSVVQPFGQVADVLTQINTRLGLTGKPLQDLTQQVLDFSHATGTDATANAAAFLDIISKWEIPAEESAGAIDMILRASQAAGVPVSMLSDNLAKFAGVFKTLGYDMPQALALMGQLGKTGQPVEKVLNGMQMGIARMSKGLKENIPPSLKHIDGIGETWVKVTDQLAEHDIEGAFDTIAAAIHRAGSDAEARAIGMEVFGSKAGPALAGALRSGSFAVDDLSNKIKNGKETTADAADAVTHFGDRMQMLWNRVTVALGPVSEKAATAATIIAGVGPALSGVGKAAEFIGPKIASAAQSLLLAGMYAAQAAAAGVSAAASWVASAATTIASWIAQAATAVASAATTAAAWVASWVAMAAGAVANAAVIAAAWLVAFWPIALIGAAVIGLAALIFFHWEKVRGFLVAVWNGIKAAAAAIWNAILAFFKRWGIFIVAALLGPIALMVAIVIRNWNTIRSITSAVWNGIRAVITGAVNTIRSVVSGVINAIRSAWSGGMNAIRSAASGAWNFVVGIFESAWRRISGIVSRITGALSKLAFWRRSPSILEQHARDTAAGILNAFEDVRKRLPGLATDLNLRVPAIAAGTPTAGGAIFGEEIRGLRAEVAALREAFNVRLLIDGREIARSVDNRKGYEGRANR
jgi:TP901 family phage tail tape measure protein